MDNKKFIVLYGSEENLYEPKREDFDSREDAIAWIKNSLIEDLEDEETNIKKALDICLETDNILAGDTDGFTKYRKVYFVGTEARVYENMHYFRKDRQMERLELDEKMTNALKHMESITPLVSKDELEKRRIQVAIESSSFAKAPKRCAAKLLNISERTLYRKMKKHGIK